VNPMTSKRPLRIVLQCRLSSSRLPAKVLLPVGGLPIAVLAAKRAMRGGKDLVLATSVEPSDDLLADAATRHGVPVMRGPLDDVLGFDREHVTPYIRRTYAPAQMPRYPGLSQDWGHLRATVDTFDDYQTVAAVCADLDDPVGVPWQDLVHHLQALPNAPEFHVRPQGGDAGMVLGTVQLGLAYGRANTSGMPSEAQAETIVHTAIRHGVSEIDTARAYGQSEARLGRIMSRGWSSRAALLTKLDPLSALSDDLPERAVTAMVRESVLASCHALKLDKLPVLMLHRAEHLDLAEGRAWQALLRAQEQGLIAQLGVSVQSPDELRRIAAIPEITHVQLPCNILDPRWEGCADLLRARKDLRVHVRSAYLQGLLTPAAPDKWPAIEGLDAGAIVQALEGLTRDLDYSIHTAARARISSATSTGFSKRR